MANNRELSQFASFVEVGISSIGFTTSVGIGTTNPQFDLDVAGDINFTGTFYQGGTQFIASRWSATGSDIYRLSKVGINTSIVSSALTVNGDVSVSGVVTATSINVSGISTLGITSATNLTSQSLVVSGISTLGITSATNLTSQSLVVSGISTLGITSATNLTSQSLVVSGISTLGITSATNLTTQQLNVSGISTFTNGPILVGTATSTGTASQPLQVTGGAYVSGSFGIGTTNPASKLTVVGDVNVSGAVTATELIGGGSELRNLSGTHLVSYASHSETSNSALSIAGISTYNQVGILTGSLAVDGSDFFGISVATSADGKTIIVGANNDQIGATYGTGVVYVFDRVGSSFNQVGILTGSLAVDGSDYFGSLVATSADGKTIVVGAWNDEIGATNATGVVYVYDRVGSSFNQVGILTGSLAVNASDNFGISVATSADGKTIVVGASSDEQTGSGADSGVVYVFDRVGSSFNQVGILTGSLAVNASDNFGSSVATSADGKTIVVGAYNDEIGATSNTGVVYVYDRVGSSFNQVGILTGSLAVDTNDNFGIRVATSADGKTIVVGAYTDEIGATSNTGVVYVYDRVGSSFNQVGILTGSLAVNSSDGFGYSVATSADGKTIVVGAYYDEIGATLGTGVVYIFKRQGNSFNQVGILTGSLAVNASDFFGISVATSADGKTIIVGAYDDEIGATLGTGVVYVYDQTRDTYVHSGPTGNIGIGITNPTSKLHVVGDVYISGISTLGITSTTNLTSQSLVVSGISTLGITSATNLTSQSLVVSGISTLGITSATNLTSQSLVVSGISTLGITTATNLTSQSLVVSGISTLGITSTTNLTSQSLVVSGNLGIGTTNPTAKLSIGSVSGFQDTITTVATTAVTTIDSFATATFRSTRVQVQITQSTNYQASDVLIIHDGTTASIVEYGSIATNDYLGTFSASVSGGNCLLRINMSSATSATVKVLSQRITV